MSKITFYPLVIVLAITFVGFYFLYSQKTQLATDVDLLKDQIDIIKKDNQDLSIRMRTLEEGSIKSITQKASKTLQRTVDTMLNAIDQKVEEARRLNAAPKKYTEEQTDSSSATSTPSTTE